MNLLGGANSNINSKIDVGIFLAAPSSVLEIKHVPTCPCANQPRSPLFGSKTCKLAAANCKVCDTGLGCRQIFPSRQCTFVCLISDLLYLSVLLVPKGPGAREDWGNRHSSPVDAFNISMWQTWPLCDKKKKMVKIFCKETAFDFKQCVVKGYLAFFSNRLTENKFD